MAERIPERRRMSRIEVDRTLQLHIGQRVRAKVIDISASGALVWTDEPLRVGAEGRLNILLEGQPLEAQLRVTRERTPESGTGRLLGVELKAVKPPQEQVLEQFLRRAGSDPTMD